MFTDFMHREMRYKGSLGLKEQLKEAFTNVIYHVGQNASYLRSCDCIRIAASFCAKYERSESEASVNEIVGTLREQGFTAFSLILFGNAHDPRASILYICIRSSINFYYYKEILSVSFITSTGKI